MKFNKNLIFFVIILIIGISALVIWQKNKGVLEIDFEQKNVNLKINKKIYFVKNKKFEKKMLPGKYKIEADKKDYEKYEQSIIINPHQKINLVINLRLKKDIEKNIKNTIKNYVKENNLFENYKIEIKKTEENYVEAGIYPKEKEQPLFLILKKINGNWKIITVGTDIDLDTHIKNERKEALIKSLPYISENFEVYYIDYLDQFYVIIKKEPIDRTKQEARNWFDSQGIDRNNIVIRWSLSPVLIRNK